MKASKDLALTFAEKCKVLIISLSLALSLCYLNTVKADAKGSKEEIHTSRIMYFLKRGKPYLCVPQDDLHNLNVVIDERGSMAVANPYPGPLANVLKSIGKLPTRVALTGDVLSLEEEKMRHVKESLRETIELEKKAFSAASYAVTEILSSSRISSVSRTDNLRDVLSAAMFSEKLIDGINQNRARRNALMLFCFEYLEMNPAFEYTPISPRLLVSLFCENITIKVLHTHRVTEFSSTFQNHSLFCGICISLSTIAQTVLH
ncbi:hypothetical protein MKW92_047771 [Papaver armeniacum]|nr:hypothetical protein MKW92_047771 [Papaver armeniacum]